VNKELRQPFVVKRGIALLICDRYLEKNQLRETILPDGTPNDLTDNPRIKIDYDEAGNRKAVTDPEGNTTHFKYDSLNRPTEMIHPDRTPDNLEDNPRIKVEYDKLGRMKALTDERGNRNEFEYDAAGKMKVVRSGAGGSQQTTSTYDAGGREITRTNALNRTTKFVYDNLDRIVETIFPDQKSIKVEYDAFGNIIAQTDQANRTTSFEYDALNRLTAVVDAKQQRMEYKYDEAGNLISQEDAKDRVTKFEYDGFGRRTAVVRPLLQRLETVYDKVGNIKRTTDFNGETIEYEYDSLNQLKTQHFLSENRSVQFTYTPTGRRETVTDGRGITAYDYDERGLLLSRMEPDNTLISYTYNQAGLVETIVTPSGTTTYRYDSLNRLEKVIEPNNQETIYTYDEVGNLKNISLPNGTAQTYSYDELNRLKYLENKDPQDNILSSYTYTFDAVGNRQKVEENGGRKVEYTYDELYRLTKEVITDPVNGSRTIEYTYDAVGNRDTKNDSVIGLTTYTYDGNDRLRSETTAGVTTNYTYDNNGNLILADLQNSPEQVKYFWDGENRLTEVEITDASGTKEIQYRYDADGIRVASIVGGEETRYLVDANRPYAQVLEEYEPGGVTQVSYAHGLSLISQNRNGNKSFYLFDGHSGVRQLSNSSGTITDKYNFDAFGNLLSSTGSTNNNYLYRGEQFDSNLGWQYLRARYYDPNVGRFPSVDPFEGWQEQPMSRHRYLYGNANPVTYSDPSGLMSLSELNVVQVLARDLAIGGLAIASPQQLIRQFVARDSDSVKWNGYQVSVDTGSVLNNRRPPIADVSIGSDFFFTDSEPFPSENGWFRVNNSLLIAISGGITSGRPSPSFTGGTFEVNSPGDLGLSPFALSGGFLSMSGSLGLGLIPRRFGVGAGASFLILGSGRGNANGLFFANSGAFAVSAKSGIGIHFIGELERVQPTPQTS
jgi:RHS repeat-associated protein